MGTRILHFGQDGCNRLMVLRSAGYAVELCSSLSDLDSALHIDTDPAAIVMSDMHGSTPREAVTFVHSQSSAALILFRHPDYSTDECDFDLVIPNLTPVREWLSKMAATIEKSRALPASARDLRRRSELLIQETRTTGERTAKQLKRLADARSRAKEILNPRENNPDPTDLD